MTSLEFAELARRLSATARRLGVEPPAFRSPPRSPLHTRALARRPDGSATVSIRLRHRSGLAVAADMIDGLLASAAAPATNIGEVRDELWLAAESLLSPAVSFDQQPSLQTVAA